MSTRDDGTLTDDRTTKARIRDAAIDCFAEHGVAGTTTRKVAVAARVSPGLVIHHYGSMDGLRAACDTYVAASIRQQKQETIMAGANFDVMDVIRNSKVSSMGGYLARVLVDDSPAVAKLVDDLVADAEGYMQQGVESGTLQPSANPKARAVVISLWTMGALVLHRHMNRLLGVDLADPAMGTDAAIASYLGSVYEILGNGILTESVAAQLQNQVADIAGEERSEPPASSV
jgi:AcrR family transcriptional regulator